VTFLRHFVANSGNCLQKTDILDLSLIKLFHNQEGCNFYAPQCRILVTNSINIHTLLFLSPREWIGLSSVLRPRQHSIGYMGDGFYRSKTQPTVSKYWRRCYKGESKQRKQL